MGFPESSAVCCSEQQKQEKREQQWLLPPFPTHRIVIRVMEAISAPVVGAAVAVADIRPDAWRNVTVTVGAVEAARTDMTIVPAAAPVGSRATAGIGDGLGLGLARAGQGSQDRQPQDKTENNCSHSGPPHLIVSAGHFCRTCSPLPSKETRRKTEFARAGAFFMNER
jgi:hypothetical protein